MRSADFRFVISDFSWGRCLFREPIVVTIWAALFDKVLYFQTRLIWGTRVVFENGGCFRILERSDVMTDDGTSERTSIR